MAYVVLSVNIRSKRYQFLHYFRVTIGRGVHQRCPSILRNKRIPVITLYIPWILLTLARMHSEGYSSRSVCMCVCRRLFGHYRLRGGPLAIPTGSELREPENLLGDFPETTVFERYAVKTSEKANMHNRTGLTAT